MFLVATDHVLDEKRPALEMIGRRTYFDVVINEAWLTVGSRWLKEFEPMVYVITEFEYGGEMQAVPFVVGPQLIRRHSETMPADGVRFLDTRVAGPHPFPGRVALTVVLCAVLKDDHAKDLVGTMESAVKVLDVATAVVPYLKVAEVLLTGLQSLAQADKVRAIVGQRAEFDHADGLVSPLYCVLVASEDVDRDYFWVRRGRLEFGPGPDSTRPFRDSDFVLYRLGADVCRDDVERLPFANVKQRAYEQAGRATQSGEDRRKHDPLWVQAKATLFNLEEEALGSPDLIESHVDELIADWRDRMLAIRDLAERRVEMAGRGPATPAEQRQQRAAEALDL